ncbi:MAG: spore germination protein GerW family protein [Actinomycetota bacterium]|nr:spore germination protein GerW family protein [Actinomycetota bacterium]
MTLTEDHTTGGFPPGLETLGARVREILTVERVVGEPIERGGVTVVPVVSLRGGGGGGGGQGQGPTEEEGSGGGLGFGVTARPVGAYVIRDGDVTWEPAVDPTKVAVTIVAVAFLVTRVLRRLLR